MCVLFIYVRILILSSNQITRLPSLMSPLMISIDLSYNQLTNISMFMKSMMFQLQTLNLSWNKLEFLQGYFILFNKLQLIDLSHNRLQQVALMIFSRYQNPITTPQTNPFLSHALDVSNNNLTYIEMSALKFFMLNDLDLSFNRFQTLSIGEVSHHDIPHHDILIDDQEATNCSLAMLRGLVDLQTLNVSQNNIKHLSQNDFCDLTRLRILDLSGNFIKHIQKNVFKHLGSLTYLMLQENMLTVIKPNIFSPLRQITLISLADNNLFNLDNNLFDKNPKLMELRLHNNHLTTIPPAVSTWDAICPKTRDHVIITILLYLLCTFVVKIFIHVLIWVLP